MPDTTYSTVLSSVLTLSMTGGGLGGVGSVWEMDGDGIRSVRETDDKGAGSVWKTDGDRRGVWGTDLGICLIKMYSTRESARVV